MVLQTRSDTWCNLPTTIQHLNCYLIHKLCEFIKQKITTIIVWTLKFTVTRSWSDHWAHGSGQTRCKKKLQRVISWYITNHGSKVVQVLVSEASYERNVKNKYYKAPSSAPSEKNVHIFTFSPGHYPNYLVHERMERNPTLISLTSASTGPAVYETFIRRYALMQRALIVLSAPLFRNSNYGTFDKNKIKRPPARAQPDSPIIETSRKRETAIGRQLATN